MTPTEVREKGPVDINKLTLKSTRQNSDSQIAEMSFKKPEVGWIRSTNFKISRGDPDRSRVKGRCSQGNTRDTGNCPVGSDPGTKQRSGLEPLATHGQRADLDPRSL